MKRALLLIGSPKAPATSASGAIGGYLLDRLMSHGLTPRTIHLHRAVRSESGIDEIVEAVEESDLVVLASPLYVDSLPAPVIRVMEVVAARRRVQPALTKPTFVAAINSGFPEPFQSDVAIEICRLFARDAQLEWAGGFRIGGGGVVGQGPIAARGATRRLAHGLDRAAAALASGLPIPREAFELIERPLMPVRAYTMIADLSMWFSVYRRGVLGKMNDQPYARKTGGHM